MPANLTPEYRKAEGRFRAASKPEDRLAALEQMLAAIPKHKGTEKVQAEIKRRISRYRRVEVGTQSGNDKGEVFDAVKIADSLVALVGPPGSGKLSLARLASDDTKGHFISDLQDVDTVAIVLDCSDDALLDHLEDARADCARRGVTLIGERSSDFGPLPGTVAKLAVVVANKIDLKDTRENLEVLIDAYADEFDVCPISVATGEGLDMVKRTLRELNDAQERRKKELW